MGLVALVTLMDHLRAFVILAIGDDITVVSIDLTKLQIWIVNEVTSPDWLITLNSFLTGCFWDQKIFLAHPHRESDDLL